MRALIRCSAALAIAIWLLGCSTGSIGVRSDVDSYRFEAGKTTRAEVINTIGLPQRIDKDEAGNEHFFYERKAHLTGMCLGCGFANNSMGIIPAAAIDSSQKKAKNTAIEFVFNPAGTLINGF
jgi:hypothetical protein